MPSRVRRTCRIDLAHPSPHALPWLLDQKGGWISFRYLDMSLGDLLEGIVLLAFEGRAPFEESTLEKIEQLKGVYDMEYGAEASHKMEGDGGAGAPPT